MVQGGWQAICRPFSFRFLLFSAASQKKRPHNMRGPTISKSTYKHCKDTKFVVILQEQAQNPFICLINLAPIWHNVA